MPNVHGQRLGNRRPQTCGTPAAARRVQHPYTFQAAGQLRPWLHIKLGAARGLRKQHGLQHARHVHMCDSRSAACNNRTAQQHPLSGWRSSPCHASPPRAACPSCRLNSLLQWKASPIVQPQPCGTCPPNDVRLALGVDMVCEPAVRSDAADRRSGPQNICHGRCIGTQLVSRREEHQPACAPPQAGKVAAGSVGGPAQLAADLAAQVGSE